MSHWYQMNPKVNFSLNIMHYQLNYYVKPVSPFKLNNMLMAMDNDMGGGGPIV